MGAFFKDLWSSMWGSFKVVLPSNIKKLVVGFFNKNPRIMLYLDPAMRVIKFVSMSFGKPEIAAIITAIQRNLSMWGITNTAGLPVTIKTLFEKGESATLEEAKVALRDTVKEILKNQAQVSLNEPKFADMSESQQNLVVELAYNLVKDEIQQMKEVGDTTYNVVS